VNGLLNKVIGTTDICVMQSRGRVGCIIASCVMTVRDCPVASFRDCPVAFFRDAGSSPSLVEDR